MVHPCRVCWSPIAILFQIQFLYYWEIITFHINFMLMWGMCLCITINWRFNNLSTTKIAWFFTTTLIKGLVMFSSATWCIFTRNYICILMDIGWCFSLPSFCSLPFNEQLTFISMGGVPLQSLHGAVSSWQHRYSDIRSKGDSAWW